MINNKRQYFRVDLLKEIPAIARIYSVNNRAIDIDKTIPVSLLDLSAGGMRVRIPYNLPTQIIILDVNFEFENEHYNLHAQVLRRTSKSGSYEYGLKFLTSHDQISMQRCLNMYKIKNTKHRKVEWDLKLQKYIGCFVKFLELIDEPAYLITSNRLVVACNLKAQAKGIKLGERCYKTICSRNSICPYCELEKAIKEDQVIEADAIVQGKACTARWLYTEDGLTLHYFK